MAEEQAQSSFLDLNLDEVPELHAVPGNREYRLKVSDVREGTSDTDKTRGQNYLLFFFNIMDEPDTKRVTYPVMLPHESLDQEQNNSRKRQLKRLLQACDFDVSQGFNPDELIGLECHAILEEEDDPQYGEQNSVKRFLNFQG